MRTFKGETQTNRDSKFEFCLNLNRVQLPNKINFDFEKLYVLEYNFLKSSSTLKSFMYLSTTSFNQFDSEKQHLNMVFNVHIMNLK